MRLPVSVCSPRLQIDSALPQPLLYSASSPVNQSDAVLQCNVDAPEPVATAARYAIETLLRPLGLRPEWTKERPVLFYGPASSGAEYADGVHVPLEEATTAYFQKRRPYDARASFDIRGVPYLFGNTEAPDPIASAFFFLSGWDEHSKKVRDEHGRFCYRHSVQKELQVAVLPVVDRYRDHLSTRLRAAGVVGGKRHWGGRKWAFLPTFDIDYLREWRPGTIVREIRKRPLDIIRGLLTGRDAFLDGFHNLITALSAREVTGTFFFKAGHRSAYDPAYRRQPREISRALAMVREQDSELGLHPGYYSATHPDYLREERRRLEELAGATLRSVRQHYLRYDLPRTSRLHAGEHFEIDSTLGFADHEGFRRGTALPFQIYDPLEHRVLNVWELPLCFMDGTMVARRGLSPEESLDALESLMEACRSVGGACVPLWHNILWERGMEGWPEHLDRALGRAADSGAWIGGLHEALASWR